MPEAQALKALIAAAHAPMRDWATRYPGYRAMGTMCSYVPGEMLHAAGLTPVRLRGTTAPLRRVDAHLQSFTCALCRSTLDQVLGGELDFLEGTIFAHTCDAMQAQADLWRMNTGSDYFVDTVMQPANLGSSSSRIYLIAELSRIRERLSDWTGRPMADDNLQESIALYDEMRRLVGALQELRGCLSTRSFFAVLDAAQVMPLEVFNPLLEEFLAQLEDCSVKAATKVGVARLFLVGAVLDEPRLLDLIEEVGALVAGDDLCSGSRHFREQVGTEGDPIANLADYYLSRPPCPTKFHPTHNPSRFLLEQVGQACADGVVFVLEKFCEPHAFDYALARPILDEAGIPHLLLEMEQTPSLEAIRTRLQAFVEML